MQIRINFTDDRYILVKLFDNDAVYKWFNTFSSDAKNYIINVEVTPPMYSSTLDINKEWNTIKNTFKDLQKFNFNPSIVIADTFDNRQKTLNELHRFFTYNVLWAQKPSSERLKNQYDENFKFPTFLSFSEWHSIIDNINVAVHKLESAVIRNNTRVHSLAFRRNNIIKLHWLEFTKQDYDYNYEYFFKKTEYNNLVLLDKSILGKCPLQSFFDDDDPTADDCTGRLGSFGGFVIELDNMRHQVYQSTEFKNWLQKYQLDVTELPCEFPIGYVKETNVIDLTKLKNKSVYKDFKNLEFLKS